MKKRVALVLEVESEDEFAMADDFIKRDLETEINCACNSYDIISIETEILKGKLMEQKSASIPYPCCWGCGCDFGSSKYKEDCYFYGETHDMGATIRYCRQEEIKWGYCPCDKCDHYISKSAADRIIRGNC